jgi:intracellular septation protein A
MAAVEAAGERGPAADISAKSILLGSGPRFARDTFSPVLAFYVGWKLGGLVVGILISTVVAVGAWLYERRQSRPGLMARLTLGVVIVQALLGLASDSEVAFLAPQVIVNLAWGLAFVGSCALGRPLAGVFAAEMADMPPDDHRQLHADAHVLVCAVVGEAERDEPLEVVLLGPRQQRRNERRGERVVERAEDDGGDDPRFHDHLLGGAGPRMHESHARRIRLESGEQRANAHGQVRLCGAARCVGVAGSQQFVERPLCVACGKERQAHIGRRDAVEDHRSHTLAMPAQVDEGRPRAVGAAIQIDVLVAEMRADRIEVVHRDARRVVAHVGVVTSQAGFQPGKRLLVGFHRLAEGVGRRSTVERVRLAGATLVDEDDIAVAEYPPEDLPHLRRELRRRLTGSAGEEEQRVGTLSTQRGQHDDVQRDAAAGGCLRILEHLE